MVLHARHRGSAARPWKWHGKRVADRGGRTVGHEDQSIGQVQRFIDVVRDHDHGLVGFLPDTQQDVLQLEPRQRVELRERLVEEQEARLERQRSRQRHALLRPERQLDRAAGPPASAMPTSSR